MKRIKIKVYFFVWIVIVLLMVSCETQKTEWQGMVEETLHFEKHRAYFDNILSDDRQRLYVRRVKSVFDEGSGFEFDVFNREGYIQDEIFPFPLRSFRMAISTMYTLPRRRAR